MRMHRTLLIALVLVVASFGGVAAAEDAPEPALFGVVTDTLTGEPVAGVNVHLHRVVPGVGPGGPMVTATTEADGSYVFHGTEWLEEATHVGIHRGMADYEQLWQFIRWDGQTVPFELDLDLFPYADGAKVVGNVVDAVSGEPLSMVDAFLHYVEPDASPIPFLPYSGPGEGFDFYRVEADRDLYIEAWSEGYLSGWSEVVSWDGVTPTELVVPLRRRNVDVPIDSTHAAGIDWLVANGYASGYPDGTFRPGEEITRAQMATLLTNVLDLPPGDETFIDVRSGATHEDAIAAIVAAGITQGYEDGTFRPGAPVLRAHMASFLANAFELDPVVPDFLDVDVDGRHAGAIGAVVDAGYAQGYSDSTFRPNEPVTRAQMATLLMNALAE